MKHSSCRRRCDEVSETTILLFMTSNTEFSPFWSPGQGGRLCTVIPLSNGGKMEA